MYTHRAKDEEMISRLREQHDAFATVEEDLDRRMCEELDLYSGRRFRAPH